MEKGCDLQWSTVLQNVIGLSLGLELTFAQVLEHISAGPLLWADDEAAFCVAAATGLAVEATCGLAVLGAAAVPLLLGLFAAPVARVTLAPPRPAAEGARVRKATLHVQHSQTNSPR